MFEMTEFSWSLAAFVFAARMTDVSMGTVRMIFVIAGWRWRAATIGFFEVTIWALATGGLIGSVTHPVMLAAYAGGFASGNLIGIGIERRLALGFRMVRVVNTDLDVDLSARLRGAGYRVTRVEGTGRDGPVEIAFAVVKRRTLPTLLTKIKELTPKAIVTVERADSVSAEALGTGMGMKQRGWLGGVRK
ncbi:MAG: DUF5698 domain-containing protein [Planctomycetota bacterium]